MPGPASWSYDRDSRRSDRAVSNQNHLVGVEDTEMHPAALDYKAFNVGPIVVDPPLLLAPMEDVTNLPFRLIAKRIGKPGLMFTEFVSAMAIRYGATKTLRKMRIHPDERPLGIQIFGGNPEVMVETALIAE